MKPILIYDGDCAFCKHWIRRWQAKTGDLVEYVPYQSFDKLRTDPEQSRMGQQVAHKFSEIPIDQFKAAVQLIYPHTKGFGVGVSSAAEAVFRTLALGGKNFWWWLYQYLPGFKLISEWFYQLVAKQRDFFYWWTEFLWGQDYVKSNYSSLRKLFLKLLGLIYCIAFVSLLVQITGLIGSHGILPVENFHQSINQSFGYEKYWLFPTLTWFTQSDAFIQVLTLSGVVLSLLVIMGLAIGPVFLLLWLLYLSLTVSGQIFTAFQWDILLLEVGFLAIFFAPWSFFPLKPCSALARLRDGERERLRGSGQPSKIIIWLYRILLFRLMFSSGVVKILSQDPSWRNLEALNYHYATQPLPTPLAWYIHNLPEWWQRWSTTGMFIIEIFVPFLIFAPRRLRIFGAALLALLQILIYLSGNYTAFNLITLALILLLLDDQLLSRNKLVRFFTRPHRLTAKRLAGAARTNTKDKYLAIQKSSVSKLIKKLAVSVLAVIIISIGIIQLTSLFVPRQQLFQPAKKLWQFTQPFHIVNSYGLFAVMTTKRFEIIVQGSNDGETWLDYNFKYKPGDISRPPPWVAPHQPRLDWQMWFAALSNYQSNNWYVSFMKRVLEGQPEVLALLESNPFPKAPPRMLRAQIYEYHFTNIEQKRDTRAWWRRELKGLYFPAVTLDNFQ